MLVLHEILNHVDNLSTRLLELPLNNLLPDEHTKLFLEPIQVVPALKERLQNPMREPNRPQLLHDAVELVLSHIGIGIGIPGEIVLWKEIALCEDALDHITANRIRLKVEDGPLSPDTKSNRIPWDFTCTQILLIGWLETPPKPSVCKRAKAIYEPLILLKMPETLLEKAYLLSRRNKEIRAATQGVFVLFDIFPDAYDT